MCQCANNTLWLIVGDFFVNRRQIQIWFTICLQQHTMFTMIEMINKITVDLVLSNDCFPSMFLKEQFRMVCGDAWAPSVQGCWNNAGSRNKTHTLWKSRVRVVPFFGVIVQEQLWRHQQHRPAFASSSSYFLIVSCKSSHFNKFQSWKWRGQRTRRGEFQADVKETTSIHVGATHQPWSSLDDIPLQDSDFA